jgi:virginiamycin B lyase
MNSSKICLLLAGTSLAAVLLHIDLPVQAQTAVALSGKVTSAQELVMEGVIVSAKMDGSTKTISVVTNEKGEYSFPAAKLEPGKYNISIRAAGYDLDGAKAVDVAAAGGKADLTLVKAKNEALQLSTAEWLMSAPGLSDKQKASLGGCLGCHTLQRAFMSTHTSEEWPALFQRMGFYYQGSVPTKPQLLVQGGARGERVRVREDAQKTMSDWLAKSNLSAGDKHSFEFTRIPRPKGRATHVVYTEYDLPRKDAEPHDAMLGPDGNIWYSDFGALFIGQLDPKTGKVTDFPLPVMKPEEPKGTLALSLDKQGNFWIAGMYQAGVYKFDTKTQQVTPYPFPKEWQTNSTQASMCTATSSHIDGKVWVVNNDTHNLYKLDVATGQYQDMGVATDANGSHISGYGMPTDSKNNVYLLEQGNTRVGLVDAKTNVTKIWTTPTLGSKPRRGRVDDQDRVWFGEFGGNAIGMFDPKTEKIAEWKLPTPWSGPYDAELSRTGDAWAGSMYNDHVSRVITTKDEFVEYLLPRPTNIRRVFVDNRTTPPSLWIGNNHGAAIIHVEPTD